MIPHHIQFAHLHPTLWRNLGGLTQLFFKERVTLWLLLKNGNPIRAVVENLAVPLPETVQPDKLFELYPQVRCIIFAEEESLLQYYREVNSKIEQPVPAEKYFSYAVQRLRQDKGIRYCLKDGESLPPPPWVDFYGMMGRIIRQYLPPTVTYLLDITDGGNAWFQLAVTLHNHEILRVSTFDSYSRLLGLNEIAEPLMPEQLKKVESAENNQVIYHRVDKASALSFLAEYIKEHI